MAEGFVSYDETLHGFGDPAALLLCYRRKPRRYILEGYVPVSVRARILCLACLPEFVEDKRALDSMTKRYAAFRLTYAKVTFKELRALVERIFRPSLKADAESLLSRRMPHYSISHLTAGMFARRLTLGVIFLVLLGARVEADLYISVLFAFALTAFFVSVVVKLCLWVAGAFFAEQTCGSKRFDAWKTSQPYHRYSVVVPLYREPEVAVSVLEATKCLDYPRHLLDVVLVLEADDAMTPAVLPAREALPDFIDIVVAPQGAPKTKPRACNYVLPLLRGECVAVFDAEDAPDPHQLRMAEYAFRMGSARDGAFQARLYPYNASENWLAMCFALEYAMHFGGFLPGLQKLGWPLLLGGAGNHFRVADLLMFGAWDPYNVTEDADLALRIYMKRRRVVMLPSNVREEAPVSFDAWLKQRTRWIKGHLQTAFSHSRYPLRSAMRIGPMRYLGGHLFMTLPIIVYLLAPILLALGAVNIALALLFHITWFQLPMALYVGAPLLLAVSYVLQLMIVIYEAKRLGHLSGATFAFRHLLFVPLYHSLHCLAAWRALKQLALHPWLWEKTTHGASKLKTSANTSSEM